MKKKKKLYEGKAKIIFATEEKNYGQAFAAPYVETKIEADDEVKQYKGFNAFIDQHSIPFLEDAVVDFQKDSMGGQLTIKAPNSRMPKLTKDSPLEDHINYILYNEINPGLAAHGGHVTLEEIFEDSVAVLRFGGGCQGCGMVDVTLKDGVEKTLMSQIPQLTEVRDVTDHSIKENAYYQ